MDKLWLDWVSLGYQLNELLPFAPTLAQLSAPIQDPVAVFLVILAIMLIAPLLFERLKMLGIIGLILAGVMVSPHGFGLLARDSSSRTTDT